MSELGWQLTEQGKSLVLKLQGQFTHTEMGEFDARLADIVERRPSRLVVDMADLSMLSSAGIGALLKLQQRTREFKCDVRLAALQGTIESVMRAARLDSIFTLAPTVSDAMN